MAQTLMLDIALNLEDNQLLNLEALKKTANEHAQHVKEDKDFEKARDGLKKDSLMAEAKKPEAKPAEPAPAEAKK